MDLNFPKIIHIMGDIFKLTGVLMLLPVLVGLIYREWDCVFVFLAVLVPIIIVGFLLNLIHKDSDQKLHLREGYLIVALSWIVISLLSAIPYVIQGSIPNYIDAFFETCSGYSTTGASVLTKLDGLPHAILFWRSFANWIGGMGILVFAIAFMPGLGIEGQTIISAETPGPTLTKIAPKITNTARILYSIYLVMSAAEIILLLLGGVNLFDAVCHTFATVGTGGFSTHTTGVGYFNSTYVNTVITFFMFLAGINFNLYFLLLARNFRKVRYDSELKLYVLLIVTCTFLVAMNLSFGKGYSFSEAMQSSSFQVVSILTTTGFATDNYNMWPTFSMMILFLLFFVGGCASSTSGGMKVIRVLVLVKSVRSAIGERLHPRAVGHMKVSGEVVDSEQLKDISSFMFLYAAVIFVVGFLVTLDDVNLVTGFSAAASCLGNIGPGFESVGPILNYGFLAWPTKLLLSFTMICGRLELYTFLILFSRQYWNPYR